MKIGYLGDVFIDLSIKEVWVRKTPYNTESEAGYEDDVRLFDIIP